MHTTVENKTFSFDGKFFFGSFIRMSNFSSANDFFVLIISNYSIGFIYPPLSTHKIDYWFGMTFFRQADVNDCLIVLYFWINKISLNESAKWILPRSSQFGWFISWNNAFNWNHENETGDWPYIQFFQIVMALEK